MARYPDVAASGKDPFEHFVRTGRSEGRFPNLIEETRRRWEESFDAAWYLNRYPDVCAVAQDPFEHFLRFGLPNGRFPNQEEDTRRIWSDRFDAAWYAARYPDVAEAAEDPFDHFVRYGLKEGRFPTEREEITRIWGENFNPAWYAARYPDVAGAGIPPFEHFLLYGFREGRFANAREEAKIRFDARWYVERYPEVAEDGGEPVDHFLQVGLKEGRFANAAEEARAALAERFDPAWYVARNLDLEGWKRDPFEHFLQFGLAEGRSANPAEEALVAWTARVDRDWYAIRHEDALRPEDDPLEHFMREGWAKGFAPNPREEKPEGWTGIFDARWYLERYDDVAAAGIDPLRHYIQTGIQQRRRPNGRISLSGSSATAARARWLKLPTRRPETVLFVTHSVDGALKPHVPAYLAAIRAADLGCILIVASDADEPRLEPSEIDIVDGVLFRENTGFDFAAWAHAISLSPPDPDTAMLILANDSVFGPISVGSFRALLDRIRSSSGQVVGLTENFERGWHIQSYFIALKHESARDPQLLEFFADVRSLKYKEQVVTEYEARLSRVLVDAGHDCVTLFPSSGLLNVTLRRWRQLLRHGLPFLKVSAVNRTLSDVDIIGWREALASESYDVSKADATLSLAAAQPKMGARHPETRDSAEVASLHDFIASGLQLNLSSARNPTLSIVLITQNRAERAFHLLSQSGSVMIADTEVIVFNNSSIDDTAYLLRRLDGIKRIEPVEPLPYGRALYEACREATSQAILVLDDSSDGVPAKVEEAMRVLFASDTTGAIAWGEAVHSETATLRTPLDHSGTFPLLLRKAYVLGIEYSLNMTKTQTFKSIVHAILESGNQVVIMPTDA